MHTKITKLFPFLNPIFALKKTGIINENSHNLILHKKIKKAIDKILMIVYNKGVLNSKELIKYVLVVSLCVS